MQLNPAIWEAHDLYKVKLNDKTIRTGWLKVKVKNCMGQGQASWPERPECIGSGLEGFSWLISSKCHVSEDVISSLQAWGWRIEYVKWL